MTETAKMYEYLWRSEMKLGDTYVRVIVFFALSQVVILLLALTLAPEYTPTTLLDWQRFTDPPPALADHQWRVADPIYTDWSYTVISTDGEWRVQEAIDGNPERILEDDDYYYRAFETEDAARLFVESLVIAHAVHASEAIGNGVPEVWTPRYPTIVHAMPEARSPTLARLLEGEPVQLTGNRTDGYFEVEYLDSTGWVYGGRGTVDADLAYPGLAAFLERMGY